MENREHYTKIGCIVILIRDNKLLLGKRKNISGAGTYGMPSGHLRYNEKLIDGARRELAEETGITDVEMELCAVVDHLLRDNHYVHFGFFIKGFSGEPKNMEPDKCEGWEWFPIDKLPENIFPGHRLTLNTFFKKTFYLQ